MKYVGHSRGLGKFNGSGRERESFIWNERAVIARSEATKQSSIRGEPWIASSPFGRLAMTVKKDFGAV
jgi:hypothetical protein